MGQPVVVSEHKTRTNGVLRFELNRSLTGMGHERYGSLEQAEAAGNRPPDVAAQRIFARGGVRQVHIFSNMITVTLEDGADSQGMREMLEKLYVHYLPGVQPSIPEAPAAVAS